MASTLSMPITASAMTMVRTAAAKLAAGALTRWLSSSLSWGVSSLRAIQTRARPPASMKPGTARM